ncbi:hypothetical protein GCM10007874_62810 [Labrys miyagiensis]|uniref:DUF4432 domain-containing protein n=1 Tax=Labrys miyagiensis TaxID=346912 RepID=A0ABQ6CSA8_9HYPH|nr:hypothetical protein [Labrys miyagiensis]GLS23261.1 hypothetical protein GCM10007874_62810 [Labrys miyagiensis]
MTANGEFVTATADGISVTLDLAVGHIRSLVVERGGREIAPLHRAPWIEEAQEPDTPAHLARLSGDFLCAPFGLSDIDGSPAHGWPANSSWKHLETRSIEGGSVARFELEKQVMGARVTKEFTVRDGHPFLYQRHLFSGGEGAVSVGLHMMVSLPQGGHLSFSPKRFIETPVDPQEADPARGRSLLAYPAHFQDLKKAPRADGGTANLVCYPFDRNYEDCVMMPEVPGRAFAWGAALRHREHDLVLSLKRPEDFPSTLLWMSNGGRYYSPWNSRHRGVLGLEEVRSYLLSGHKASIAPNPFSDQGIPTSIGLTADGEVDLRQATGIMPVPASWDRVTDVEVRGKTLAVLSDNDEFSVPYDPDFILHA